MRSPRLPRRTLVTSIALLPLGARAWAAPQAPRPDDPRRAFLKEIQRPRVPLAARSKALPETPGGLSQEHVTFGSEARERVPALIVKAVEGPARRPAVVVLHGTGGHKEQMLPHLEKLAGRGFVAVAIDGRHHGERKPAELKGSAAYVQAVLATWRTGKGRPFLYDTVWDVLRLLDYLERRPDVDRKAIGVTGFSKGGMETYLAAAVDPRIAVAAPLIGVQSFGWALENDVWQSRVSTLQPAVDTAAREAGAKVDAAFVRRFYDRVMPGIHDRFDGPAMLPLIAPRPLLVVNGDTDARTPMGGLQLCLTAAERAYANAGHPERFHSLIQPNTGHKVTDEALTRTFAFLETWLMPGQQAAAGTR